MGQRGLLCTLHPWKSETRFLLLTRPPPISKVDAINESRMAYLFWAISKWPPLKFENHVLCHNLSSKVVRVTKLVSIYMFLGARNLIMPIKNVSHLWKINKQLFKRIFGAFLIIFCASPRVREGYWTPSTHESLVCVLLSMLRRKRGAVCGKQLTFLYTSPHSQGPFL